MTSITAIRGRPGLIRLAAAALVVSAATVGLWQAGAIFGAHAPPAAACSGGAAPQPANASIDAAAPAQSPTRLTAGSLAPDFEVSTLDCRRLRLSDFRGRPVLLNFWATWCAPCKQELPLIQQTLQAHAGDNLAVVAVDMAESYSAESRFIDKLGVKLTAVGYDPHGEVYTRYKLEGLPVSFFIDANGVITSVVRGALDQSQIESGVSGAIAR